MCVFVGQSSSNLMLYQSCTDTGEEGHGISHWYNFSHSRAHTHGSRSRHCFQFHIKLEKDFKTKRRRAYRPATYGLISAVAPYICSGHMYHNYIYKGGIIVYSICVCFTGVVPRLSSPLSPGVPGLSLN